MEALGHIPFSARVSPSLDLEFLNHLLSPTQFFRRNLVELPRLVPSSDIGIRDIVAVTCMSITSVGEYTSSTEEMFFKTLHTIDNKFFLIEGLANEYPPPSATALYNEIRTLLSIEPHRNVSAPPKAVIISPRDNLIIGCIYKYHAFGPLGEYLQAHSLQSVLRVLDWALDIVELRESVTCTKMGFFMETFTSRTSSLRTISPSNSSILGWQSRFRKGMNKTSFKMTLCARRWSCGFCPQSVPVKSAQGTLSIYAQIFRKQRLKCLIKIQHWKRWSPD